jgi:hypothetical protein
MATKEGNRQKKVSFLLHSNYQRVCFIFYPSVVVGGGMLQSPFEIMMAWQLRLLETGSIFITLNQCRTAPLNLNNILHSDTPTHPSRTTTTTVCIVG